MREPDACTQQATDSAICEAMHAGVQATEHDAEHVPDDHRDREVVRPRRHGSGDIEVVRQGVTVKGDGNAVGRMSGGEAVLEMVVADR